MSLYLVRDKFRVFGETIGLEFHDDAFNIDNIPSSIIDGSFHVSMGEFSNSKVDMNVMTISCPVEVFIFTKGYRSPLEALDNSIKISQDYMYECLECENRMSEPLKNIVFNSMLPQAISSDNDNSVVVKISFTAQVLMSL